MLTRSVCHTGMPGQIWPSTQAFFTPRASVPTVLEVMPPLAIRKPGVTESRPTRLWTAWLILTLRVRALSLVSFSTVSSFRLVKHTATFPSRRAASSRATHRSTSAERAASPWSTRSLWKEMGTVQGSFSSSSSCWVVFWVWLPTTTRPPVPTPSATMSRRVSRGRSVTPPTTFTKPAAVRNRNVLPRAMARYSATANTFTSHSSAALTQTLPKPLTASSFRRMPS